MNADTLIKWGQETLLYLDRGVGNDRFDLARVNEKLGWLRQYRDQIEKWSHLIHVVDTAVYFVRSVGIYRECAIDLENEFEEYADDERANRIQAELISFVEEQALNAGPDEILLGSSEVIESAIGKFKTLEHDQVKSGFTSMLLSFAAFLSQTTQDVIKTALEAVPTKRISEWCKKNIGQSVQSQRKEILKLARATE